MPTTNNITNVLSLKIMVYLKSIYWKLSINFMLPFLCFYCQCSLNKDHPYIMYSKIGEEEFGCGTIVAFQSVGVRKDVIS